MKAKVDFDDLQGTEGKKASEGKDTYECNFERGKQTRELWEGTERWDG